MASNRFDVAIEAIYKAAADPSCWSGALEQVAEYVGGSGAMLAYHDLRRNEGFITTSRLREDLGVLYAKEYARNPNSVAASKIPAQMAVQATSLVELSYVKKTAFYADIMQPQRLTDFALFSHERLLAPGAGVGGFSVPLNSKQADSGSHAVRRLSRLVPHLSRALDLSLEIAQAVDAARRFDLLLEALPAAAFLLDQGHAILQANAAAEILMRAADGIQSGPGLRLIASLGDEDRRLQARLARAVDVAKGDGDRFEDTLKVQRPSGAAPYLVTLTPLPRSSFELWDRIGSRACVLMQVMRPGELGDVKESVLRDVYGLTIAEARVAVLIGAGLSAPQAAEALGVTVHTVRTQLARCFDKTGLRSQVAIARLLAAIAR
jgi:DNA-binding CsgD family transcriptional regulator